MTKENWHITKGEFVKQSDKIAEFLKNIENLCKKYDISISHEDNHGAFILEEYDETNIKWLKNSHINCE